MKTLEDLDHNFFQQTVVSLTGEDQIAFIKAKWKEIRHIVCQNSGLKQWGVHLLKLDKHKLEELGGCFKQAIIGIETKGFKLWKEATRDSHLEAILRLFFDDEIDLEDVNFTMDEKLAIFWKYDPSIIAQYRSRFEQIFQDIFLHLPRKEHNLLVTKMLVDNLITLYPYFDPPTGAEVSLIDLANDTWKIVRYRVEAIPLIEEKVFAYGLIPIEDSEVLPLLLFCGTPYPTAKGFWHSLFSNFHPFRSVGETLFLKGKKAVEQWMQDKPTVKGYGLSLGGALVYHFGKLYGKRMIIHAYAPPGLSFKICTQGDWHGVAYYHTEDLITSIGYQPVGEHFTCYGVITKAQRNFIMAHSRLSGYNPTLILKINAVHENNKIVRHLLTMLRCILSMLLYPFLLPVQFCIQVSLAWKRCFSERWYTRGIKRSR